MDKPVDIVQSTGRPRGCALLLAGFSAIGKRAGSGALPAIAPGWWLCPARLVLFIPALCGLPCVGARVFAPPGFAVEAAAVGFGGCAPPAPAAAWWTECRTAGRAKKCPLPAAAPDALLRTLRQLPRLRTGPWGPHDLVHRNQGANPRKYVEVKLCIPVSTCSMMVIFSCLSRVPPSPPLGVMLCCITVWGC